MGSLEGWMKNPMVSSMALKMATTSSIDDFLMFSSSGKVERKTSALPNTRPRVWLSKLWVVAFRTSADTLRAFALG